LPLPNDAPHPFDEALADRETQSGPSELAGGGDIRLLEGLEEARGLGGIESHPRVLDGKLDEWSGDHATVHKDRTPRGELERVRDEVQENLLHARNVAPHHGRKPLHEVVAQPDALLGGLCGLQSQHFLDTIGGLEFHLLQVEAPALDA
jgi:hypothetical protein